MVDGDPAGWQLEDTVALAHEVEALGVDVLDCSSGGISGPATADGRRQPGFQVPYASEVRRQTGLKSMAVGLITHPEPAEAILAQGDADLIAIARQALVDPAWALHAATHFGCDPQFETWPEQYGWWLNQRQKTSDFYQPEQAYVG